MNTQDYIESGELELYAAGGLTQEQRQQVERLARQHPEIQQALQEACLAMEQYALLHAQEPRPQVEEKIRQQLFGPADPIPASVDMPPIAPDVTAGAPMIPMPAAEPAPASTWLKTLGIAASILLVLSIAGNLYLYHHWQQAEQQLSYTRQSSLQYAREASQWEQRAGQAEQLLNSVRNPQVQVVQLKGVGNTPQAQATVYWNPASKEVLFDAKALPAAPQGKQYQLWSLQNGQPHDAGMVTHPEQLLRMKSVGEAQAFAVTLEPTGGSASPTLEAMVVMGKI